MLKFLLILSLLKDSIVLFTWLPLPAVDRNMLWIETWLAVHRRIGRTERATNAWRQHYIRAYVGSVSVDQGSRRTWSAISQFATRLPSRDSSSTVTCPCPSCTQFQQSLLTDVTVGRQTRITRSAPAPLPSLLLCMLYYAELCDSWTCTLPSMPKVSKFCGHAPVQRQRDMSGQQIYVAQQVQQPNQSWNSCRSEHFVRMKRILVTFH